jgi:hypothetical protein
MTDRLDARRFMAAEQTKGLPAHCNALRAINGQRETIISANVCVIDPRQGSATI